jgi:subfamily B ATP-binding cassette protein MsbA
MTSPQQRGESWSLYRRLLGYLRPYAWVFAIGLVLTSISAILDAFSFLLLIPFVRSLFGMGVALPEGGRNAAERLMNWVTGDLLGAAEGLDALRLVCVIVLIVLVFKNVFLYAAKLIAIAVQEKTERDMRDDVYQHLERLPLSFFHRSRAGQLIARVLTDTRQTKSIVTTTLSDTLRQLVTALAYLAALMLLSWRLTIVALLVVPVIVLAMGPILRQLRRRYRAAWDQQGDLVSVLEETVGGIRLIKAYGTEEYEGRRFKERSSRFASGLIRAAAIGEAASPLSEVLSSIAALTLIWVGAGWVLGGGVLTPEQFVAFVTIALRMVSPVKAVSTFPARAQQGLAAADRFMEIIDHAPEPDAEKVGQPVRTIEREIRFENVSFAYEADTPVLQDIDLSVAMGEVVALVGPSGAGKSTFVDLLPRFLEPDSGRILIDGTDLRDVSLGSLRRLMGIVSQETVIFNDTVRANIAYGGAQSRSRAEIEAAARAANAHEFIVQMPEAYETRLGDRGVRLSGGQRQRIGIARAILRDPPILILDEATSSLDTESERLIQSAIGRLLEGRTVFVIAHRLSTVQGADRILVMERGRIVDSGTHEQLHARGGTYRRLYELQFGALSDEPPVPGGV